MHKRVSEIIDLYDYYLSNYDVENMLLLVPEINKLSETYKDTSFLENFDQNMIFENYKQVFESDYQGDISTFSMDQKLLVYDLK